MELRDLICDTDDISEPTAYEKILIRLDSIHLEDEEFMQVIFIFGI